MHPKILESFWSDAAFDEFDGQDRTNMRLAFLWCFTNPATSCLGIFPANRRAFTGDTGLQFEWLAKLFAAFPRSFLPDTQSNQVLVRRYIRYQYGVGEALARNHLAKTLRRNIATVPPILGEEILRLYPELASPCQALAKGMASPSQALDRTGNAASPSQGHGMPFDPQQNPGLSLLSSPLESTANQPDTARAWQGHGMPKEKEKEKEKAQEKANGGAGEETAHWPGVEEVIAWGQFDGVDEKTCRDFHLYYEGLGWMHGNTPIRNPRSWLKRWKNNQKKNAAGTNGGGGGSARLDTTGADDLRAELQVETNPQRRREIEQQLQAMEAGR